MNLDDPVPEASRTTRRLTRRAGFLLLAPLFGLCLAGVMAISWFLLERSMTSKFATALALLATAATLAALGAMAAALLLRRRRRSSRFAAALIVLLVGTTALLCTIGTVSALSDHFGESHPAVIWLLLLAFAGAAAVYNFLASAGWLLMPLGLPVAAAFAWLMTRPRGGASGEALLSRHPQRRRART